ncbi:MAG: hypothetical protein ACRD9R_04150 [Pyrinomonadaceae bacterium]
MRFGKCGESLAACALLLLLSSLSLIGLPEVAHSQQQPRRTRPSRRVTNPVRPRPAAPQPTPGSDEEPALVSTAEEQQATESDDTQQPTTTARPSRRTGTEGARPPRDSVDRLASEVERLNRKVDSLERGRRADLIQERLTRAETRAEGLQQQLRDVMEKEANLQSRRDQLDEQMRPESLNNQIATVGTFRPDEVRENLRRQLDNEKRRVQAQLDVMAQSRTRLEASLANADAVVQRLRAQLDDEERKELEGDADGAARPVSSPTPSATPPPN